MSRPTKPTSNDPPEKEDNEKANTRWTLKRSGRPDSRCEAKQRWKNDNESVKPQQMTDDLNKIGRNGPWMLELKHPPIPDNHIAQHG